MGFLSDKLIKRGYPKYVAKYSVWQLIKKMTRKWLSVDVIPNIPFLDLRLYLYRKCGYTIGKNVFIGMKCYLDDLCADQCFIEDDVTISYGVYVAQHGKGQGHHTLRIKRGAYIGMRANIVARDEETIIGEGSVIGACSLVLRSVPDYTVYAGSPAKFVKSVERKSSCKTTD